MKLGEHDGILCIVHRDPGWSEPQWIIAYYPVGNGYGEAFRAYDFTRSYGPIDDGWIVEEDRFAGAYAIRARDIPRAQRIALTLQFTERGFTMARERDVTVFEVLYYAGDDGPSGPAGDGTFVFRSRDRREAERFASGRTCYGKPADVMESRVPRSLAQRWGCA